MCRYFPQGTKILQVTLPDKVGLRAIAGEKNGKYTFAIVNSHTVAYTINLRMTDGILLSNVKTYDYVSGKNAAFSRYAGYRRLCQTLQHQELLST